MGRLRRYPSDLTDSQWAHIEPLLPPPSQDGRKPKHPRRDLVDAILYVGRAGWAWRALPVDFPPGQTVYGYFARWHDAGVTKAVHDALRGRSRRCCRPGWPTMTSTSTTLAAPRPAGPQLDLLLQHLREGTFS